MKEHINSEESWYIWRNYWNFLPKQAFILAKIISLREKQPEIPIEKLPYVSTLKHHFPATYKELLAESAGYDLPDYIFQVTQAAFVAYGDKMHFERCPRCQALAATPFAEQCSQCPHEWRGDNPRRAAWEQAGQ